MQNSRSALAVLLNCVEVDGIGGAGADTIDGGSGSNTASYADAAAGVAVDLSGAAGTGPPSPTRT